VQLEDSAEDLYEHAPCGYLSTRPDGTIVKVNATFLGWTGHTREKLVGVRRFPDLLSPGGRIYHETHLSPLLRMQGAVRELALDIVCADGRRLPVFVNGTLKRDADGDPLLIRLTIFDATDRKRYERELLRARDRERDARERIERLQRLTALLAAAVTPEEVGRGVVEELVAGTGAGRGLLAVGERREIVAAVGAIPAAIAPPPAAAVFADGEATLPLTAGGRTRGLIWLGFAEAREFTDDDRAFMVAAAGQCAQALDRAFLHERTTKEARRSAFHADASRALDEVQGFSERVRRLLTLIEGLTGGEAWFDEPGTAQPDGRDPAAVAAVERAAATRAPQLVPGVCAALPIRARGRLLGVLGVADRGLEPNDLPFLADLADRAGLALENARLYEQERDVAQALQQSLLADLPPQDPRFAVATHYRPAIETLEVGGDWFDTFTIDTDRIGVVVGDVVGRGLTAASAMGQLRSAVRALAVAGLGPAEVILQLDAFVAQLEPARWATLAYAEVDLRSRGVRFACAGHPPPLALAPDDAPRFLWEGRSTPLFVGGPRVEAEVVLAAGTLLLLYTDGLVERREQTLDAGLDRLAAELDRRRGAPPAELVDALTDAMLVGEQHRDDVCVLCLELA
jgi:serine/threonine-protein kinase RsbW